MTERLRADLCVIGAGPAGLSVAAGASQLGARVVLIEQDRTSGNCLNVGCLASKALLAAARSAAFAARAARHGIRYGAPEIDFTAVMSHVHGVVAALAPLDSAQRYDAMGVTVLHGRARFTDRRSLLVEDPTTGAAAQQVSARRFVLAPRSRPVVPPIPGIAEISYLTGETVFRLQALPQRLLVLGGGGMGCELAQAFRRLGAEVALVEPDRLLAGEDPELVEPLRRRLLAEGVEIHEGLRVERFAAAGRNDGGADIEMTLAGESGRLLTGSHLLVAAGYRADLEGLELEAAGIEQRDGELVLDARLRTTNRHVFAAGAPGLTQLANHHAGIILKNTLFRLPARPEARAVPRAVHGDPELAQVGLTEAEARARGLRFEILRSSFFDNERAQSEREVEGLVKAIVTPRGRVLGAGIVGAQAGELIAPWVLAVRQGLGVGTLAQAMVPYPSRSEAGRRAAAGYYLPRLFNDRARRLVRALGRLG